MEEEGEEVGGKRVKRIRERKKKRILEEKGDEKRKRSRSKR